MQTLELFFRFAAISLQLLLAAVLLKEHRDKPSGLTGAAFVVSIACYLLADMDQNWGVWKYALLVGAIPGHVFLWLLARALFDDHFRLRWQHLLIALAVLAVKLPFVGLYDAEANPQGLDVVIVFLLEGLSMAFVLLALFVTLRDWRTDLVETRRRVRVVLIIVAGVHALVVRIVEVLLASAPGLLHVTWLNVINTFIIFIVTFVFSAIMLDMHPGFLVGRIAREKASAPEDVTPVLDGLRKLMEDQHLYSEHGLTIGRLAETLGIQEYKLRRIINGHYGYRNFNQYLNRYRIAEASKRLIAAETRRLPILTIALDVGYRSLGPFNKAFRENHGMTPTEYRRTNFSEDASVPRH